MPFTGHSHMINLVIVYLNLMLMKKVMMSEQFVRMLWEWKTGHWNAN